MLKIPCKIFSIFSLLSIYLINLTVVPLSPYSYPEIRAPSEDLFSELGIELTILMQVF